MARLSRRRRNLAGSAARWESFAKGRLQDGAVAGWDDGAAMDGCAHHRITRKAMAPVLTTLERFQVAEDPPQALVKDSGLVGRQSA